jgi:hypothetical protein
MLYVIKFNEAITLSSIQVVIAKGNPFPRSFASYTDEPGHWIQNGTETALLCQENVWRPFVTAPTILLDDYVNQPFAS